MTVTSRRRHPPARVREEGVRTDGSRPTRCSTSISRSGGALHLPLGALRLGQDHAALHPGTSRLAELGSSSWSEPVSNLTSSQRAMVRNKKIGFIFQSFNLIGDLTVDERRAELTYQKMGSADRKQRVESARRAGRHEPPGATHAQPAVRRPAAARRGGTRGGGEPLILLAAEPDRQPRLQKRDW